MNKHRHLHKCVPSEADPNISGRSSMRSSCQNRIVAWIVTCLKPTTKHRSDSDVSDCSLPNLCHAGIHTSLCSVLSSTSPKPTAALTSPNSRLGTDRLSLIRSTKPRRFASRFASRASTPCHKSISQRLLPNSQLDRKAKRRCGGSRFVPPEFRRIQLSKLLQWAGASSNHCTARWQCK